MTAAPATATTAAIYQELKGFTAAGAGVSLGPDSSVHLSLLIAPPTPTVCASLCSSCAVTTPTRGLVFIWLERRVNESCKMVLPYILVSSCLELIYRGSGTNNTPFLLQHILLQNHKHVIL